MASINNIVYEYVGGGDLQPFLTALDIIKLIHLMADPEIYCNAFFQLVGQYKSGCFLFRFILNKYLDSGLFQAL